MAEPEEVVEEVEEVQETDGLVQTPQAEPVEEEAAPEAEEAVEEAVEADPEPEEPTLSRSDLLEMQLANSRASLDAAERERDDWKSRHDKQAGSSARLGRELKQRQDQGESFQATHTQEVDIEEPVRGSAADDPRIKTIFAAESNRILQDEAQKFATKFPAMAKNKDFVVDYISKNNAKLQADVESLDLDRVRRSAQALLTEAALSLMTDQAPEIEASRKVRTAAIKKAKKLATPASSTPSRTPSTNVDPSQLDLTDPEQRKKALAWAGQQLFGKGGSRR